MKSTCLMIAVIAGVASFGGSYVMADVPAHFLIGTYEMMAAHERLPL